MRIWSAELKQIEVKQSLLKGDVPELEKELECLVKSDDENMFLVYSG